MYHGVKERGFTPKQPFFDIYSWLRPFCTPALCQFFLATDNLDNLPRREARKSSKRLEATNRIFRVEGFGHLSKNDTGVR